jgi:hypothetical protein
VAAVGKLKAGKSLAALCRILGQMAATYAQIRDAAADALLAIASNGAAEVQINGRTYSALNLKELTTLHDWASAQAAASDAGNRAVTAVPVFRNPSDCSEGGRRC